MVFDNAMADRKPETCFLTLRFCGKKRLADPIQYVFGNSLTEMRKKLTVRFYRPKQEIKNPRVF